MELSTNITSCPVCDGNRYIPVFEKEGVPFVRCTTDNLVLANPQPSRMFLRNLYDVYGQEYMTSPERLETTETHPEYRRRFLEFRKTNRILEIGAAAGAFLTLLRNDGWDCYGVELSEASSEYARTRNHLNVKTGTLQSAHYDAGFFDVAVAWATIEHVPDPLQVLIEACRVLRPGGLLVLSVPHWNGLSIRLIGRRYRYVCKEHLFYFGKRNLSMLLRRAGFAQVVTKTVGIDIIELMQDAFGRRQKLIQKNRLSGEQTEAASLLRMREDARTRILAIRFLPVRTLYRFIRWGVEQAGLGDALYAEGLKQ